MRLWLKVQVLRKFGSQGRFAKVCGKSNVWLSRIINGRRSPIKEDRDLIMSHFGDETEEMLFHDWEAPGKNKENLQREETN